MTITIVATAAGATSNSYVTQAEATAYFEAKPGFYALWSAMTDATKNAWLVESTRSMDRFGFVGYKYDTDQALEFPRSYPDLESVYSFAAIGEVNGEVPQRVMDAQCEMIMYLYSKGLTTGGDAERGVLSIKIEGAIDVTFDPKEESDSDDSVLSGSLSAVKRLLDPWLSSVGDSVRWTK